MEVLGEVGGMTTTAVMAAMFCCFAAPATGRSVVLNPDAVYFPDQVAYLRMARGKCGGEAVYWPGDGRCYPEGARGPCPFGFALRWEAARLRPECAPDPADDDSDAEWTLDSRLRDPSASLLDFRPYGERDSRGR